MGPSEDQPDAALETEAVYLPSGERLSGEVDHELAEAAMAEH